MFVCDFSKEVRKVIMTLEQFRKSKGYSHRQLAKFLGITGVSPEGSVCRWCTGERIPRKKTINLIKQKTDGKVKAADFYV
tara:strand:- start:490 stop:729 length:240 start_codon:yes stop_codon:yes gene_type:complete